MHYSLLSVMHYYQVVLPCRIGRHAYALVVDSEPCMYRTSLPPAAPTVYLQRMLLFFASGICTSQQCMCFRRLPSPILQVVACPHLVDCCLSTSRRLLRSHLVGYCRLTHHRHSRLPNHRLLPDHTSGAGAGSYNHRLGQSPT